MFVCLQMWAMGVILWQISTGESEQPYADMDFDDLTEAMKRGDAAVDLRESLPTEPQWATLTAMAKRCLNRDPDQRPTAAEACASLRSKD